MPYMETLHHSDDEIEMLLRRKKKIETGVQIMVDDEEEEEQEYQSYTHVTGDMQERASGIVGNFVEDIFGKGLSCYG